MAQQDKPGNYHTKPHVVVAIRVGERNWNACSQFIWDHNGASIVVPGKGVICFSRSLDGIQIPIGDWIVWEKGELHTHTDRQFHLLYEGDE